MPPAGSDAAHGDQSSSTGFSFPAPPLIWTSFKEKEKTGAWGHGQEREVSPGLTWDPIRNFGYTLFVLVSDDASREVFLCGQRLHEGPGVEFPYRAMPQLCSKANVEDRSLWNGPPGTRNSLVWDLWAVSPLIHMTWDIWHLRSVWAVHLQSQPTYMHFRLEYFWLPT